MTKRNGSMTDLIDDVQTARVALLLCVFLGLFGAHRFYLRRWGTAVLYLFTAGLLGLGWIYDIVVLARALHRLNGGDTSTSERAALLDGAGEDDAAYLLATVGGALKNLGDYNLPPVGQATSVSGTGGDGSPKAVTVSTETWSAFGEYGEDGSLCLVRARSYADDRRPELTVGVTAGQPCLICLTGFNRAVMHEQFIWMASPEVIRPVDHAEDLSTKTVRSYVRPSLTEPAYDLSEFGFDGSEFFEERTATVDLATGKVSYGEPAYYVRPPDIDKVRAVVRSVESLNDAAYGAVPQLDKMHAATSTIRPACGPDDCGGEVASLRTTPFTKTGRPSKWPVRVSAAGDGFACDYWQGQDGHVGKASITYFGHDNALFSCGYKLVDGQLALARVDKTFEGRSWRLYEL